MANICESVSSKRGKIKLVINNYILTKDKNRGNLFYWRCERRRSISCCRGFASTYLIKGQHYLRYMTDHNHTSDDSRKYILEFYENLKQKARETSYKPAQIIQVEIKTLPKLIIHLLPKYQSLRQIITRERKKLKCEVTTNDGEHDSNNIQL